MSQSSYSTLADHVWPVNASAGLARFATLALAGTVLLTLSAKAQVPFYPVPMTLQSLAVLLIGAAFGARLAAATLALYLFEGLVGLPVFAGVTAGPAYMAGPTGGFLIGFLLAAAFAGLCAERGLDRSAPKLLAVMILAHAIIFACGFLWLMALIGSAKAWSAGVEPFALATLLKTLLAAALVPALWKLVPAPRA